MELTRVKPFGKRRKTYFYGVAGTVLAAHVVVGAIIHVMPPELSAPSQGFGVEMQIVDHFLPEDAVESSAVRMVEDALVREEIKPPVFEPFWEPVRVEPDVEPIGPTATVLPDLVVEPPSPEPEKEVEPVPVQQETVEPAPVTVPPVKPAPVKALTSQAPPVKPRPAPKKEYRPPPKKKTPPPPRPAPAPRPVVQPEPKRAVPVAPPESDNRSGILDRIGDRSAPERDVQASWRKRPPPFYPYEQRKRGIEGTAHVRVSINTSGRITSARLTKSSGNAQLDAAALSSVKKGTMNPARRGGRAVSSEMIVPFEFYR